MPSQDWLYFKEGDIYDIRIKDGDFETTDGLDTAIEFSILADSRADESQVSQPELRRGSIGDEQLENPEDSNGSTIWVYIDQGRNTQDTLNDTISSSNECLQWMITDSLVQNIESSGTIVSEKGIILNIVFFRFGNPVFGKQFELWQNTTLEGDNKT